MFYKRWTAFSEWDDLSQNVLKMCHDVSQAELKIYMPEGGMGEPEWQYGSANFQIWSTLMHGPFTYQ